MPASSEPVILISADLFEQWRAFAAIEYQLSSNEGEQPVCRSRLINNRKIEIFKASALWAFCL
jgi:hypothetical protein